jgi:hypothetical protein
LCGLTMKSQKFDRNDLSKINSVVVRWVPLG